MLIYGINHVLMCMRPGKAVKIQVHKVEPMLGSGREQKPEGFTVHVNSDTN